MCLYDLTIDIYFPRQHFWADISSRTHSVLCEVGPKLLHIIFINVILHTFLLEDLDVYKVIILKWILDEQDGRSVIGFL